MKDYEFLSSFLIPSTLLARVLSELFFIKGDGGLLSLASIDGFLTDEWAFPLAGRDNGAMEFLG